MKLNGAKGVDSPRVRRNEEQTTQIENSEKLTSVESTLYQDRIDIAEAVKCLTRTHERATEWTHARTQKVGSMPW